MTFSSGSIPGIEDDLSSTLIGLYHSVNSLHAESSPDTFRAIEDAVRLERARMREIEDLLSLKMQERQKYLRTLSHQTQGATK